MRFGTALPWFALLMTAGLLLWLLALAWWRGPTPFDDAYMFYRYAMQVRDGLGIAWNPDGIQTYGLTSHLWLLVVLPFTFLPMSPSAALQLASGLAFVAAVTIMVATVTGQATTALMRNRAAVFALVGLPLLIIPFFSFNITTGMDTMASMAAHAGIAWGVLHYLARPSMARACAVGLLAFVAVLTRPDNGVVALGIPMLAFIRQWRWDRWRDLIHLAALPMVLIGVELVVCQLVFGVPLPLGFYAKSLHAYAGFQNPENPVTYAMLALWCALPFVIIVLAVTRRRDLAWLAVFVLPVLLTVIYLLSVQQVMGWSGRYYIPFLPYLIVPALLMLDQALAVDGVGNGLPKRIAMCALGALVAMAASLPLQRAAADAYLRAIKPAPIAVPSLPIKAAIALPKRGWFEVIRQISDVVIGPLPKGAVVALSEVGYVGVNALNKTVIDLVGLNDTTIGRKGFSMDYVLARQPDLIWLPNDDYTGLVSTIVSDRRLYERYTVIAGAFNYGIAIRRDSRHRALIEQRITEAWATLYPRHNIADYVVRCAPAPRARHAPTGCDGGAAGRD